LNGKRQGKHENNADESKLSSVYRLLYAIVQRITDSYTHNQLTDTTNIRISRATVMLAIETGVLAFLTAVSVAVMIAQWRTFEKTDRTLRIGERAFLYLDYLRPTTGGEQWRFESFIMNNGSTQAVDLVYTLDCVSTDSQWQAPSIGLQSSLIGPKQSKSIGTCIVQTPYLEQIWHTKQSFEISGNLFYRDVFSASHWTKFCRRIQITIDPKTITTDRDIPGGQSPCPNAPDCADSECK
jgi:hypothetical protein